MKHFLISTIFGLGVLIASGSVLAKSAGHIDFADLSEFYGEPKVEINLSSALIGMVSSLSKKEDPEVAELLSKLEFIKVRVYNLESGNANKAFETVDSVTGLLRKDNWAPIVSVNEPNEKVRIFTKLTDDIVDGLVVMVVDNNGGEAVFINIVGEIDPSQVSKVTNSLNMDLDLE